MKNKGNTQKKRPPQTGEAPFMSEQEKRIAGWLQKVHFRRAMLGVNERDVWKKIAELNEMYQELLRAERIRYDTLLEQQKITSSFKEAEEVDG